MAGEDDRVVGQRDELFVNRAAPIIDTVVGRQRFPIGSLRINSAGDESVLRFDVAIVRLWIRSRAILRIGAWAATAQPQPSLR